jgi:hypothetical protein
MPFGRATPETADFYPFGYPTPYPYGKYYLFACAVVNVVFGTVNLVALSSLMFISKDN